VNRALIAVGSNIEAEHNVLRALRLLQAHPLFVIDAISRLYASEAIGPDPRPPFINAAVRLSTDLDPLEIRKELRSIEAELGRVRTEDRYAPRTIDLDLAMIEGVTIDDDGLVIPDPEIPSRAYLAFPLADVAPDWEHPSGATLREIAAGLDDQGTRPMTKEIAPTDRTSRYALEGGMEALPDEVFDLEYEAHVRAMLIDLGEDPQREGLVKTPLRVAKAMDFLTSGYTTTLEEVVNNAIFESDTDEMVLVKDVEFYSLCEHHMLPFFGRAHVAYVPKGRIIGLSKIARIVDVFARRLQVQERLTGQIADAVNEVLMPHGVGVVLEASHFCMMMRGVQKQGSSMVTSAMRGGFKSDARTRAEFTELIGS
jgi:GTP cyclohydrolase I